MERIVFHFFLSPFGTFHKKSYTYIFIVYILKLTKSPFHFAKNLNVGLLDVFSASLRSKDTIWFQILKLTSAVCQPMGLVLDCKSRSHTLTHRTHTHTHLTTKPLRYYVANSLQKPLWWSLYTCSTHKLQTHYTACIRKTDPATPPNYIYVSTDYFCTPLPPIYNKNQLQIFTHSYYHTHILFDFE